jgi:peptidyl-prolyl cis-trans isomerase B (cyclophilin B)
MHVVAALFMMVSAITPARTWYPPALPLTVEVKSEGEAQLVLTDFAGKVIEPKMPTAFSGTKSFDLKEAWPVLASPGTFVLYETSKGKPLAQFEGTPMVIEVRADRHPGGEASADVVHVGPLEYAVMTTDQGPMTLAFYYDVAPNTVASFLDLSRTGYYDGLTFHRIIPSFVLQGGDPKGDGSGGPGYSVNAEFNDRPHVEGVLSMARAQDPNSAGSQFFVCLDYTRTQHLDNKYTAFGMVTDGRDTMKKLAATPLADPENGRPVKPPVIEKVQVKPVTAGENPYVTMFHLGEAK